ncbi:hypothetical protein OROGR_006292 [Orobanche gracilis]
MDEFYHKASIRGWWTFEGPRSTTMNIIWCAGVLILELTIGSPHVFYINARTLVLLANTLKAGAKDTRSLFIRLRSFTKLCILPPGSSLKGRGSAVPALWKCSEEFFSRQIKSRDHRGMGFSDVWAMRLVRQLLVWDPLW